MKWHKMSRRDVLKGSAAVAAVTAVPEGATGGEPRARGEDAVVGDRLREAPGVLVRWPPPGAPLPGDNAASLALEIGEARGRVLLAADLDSAREARLGVTGPLAALPMNSVTPMGPATPGAPQWMCAANTFEMFATTMR